MVAVVLSILYVVYRIVKEKIDNVFFLPKREAEAKKRRERFGIKW